MVRQGESLNGGRDDKRMEECMNGWLNLFCFFVFLKYFPVYVFVIAVATVVAFTVCFYFFM